MYTFLYRVELSEELKLSRNISKFVPYRSHQNIGLEWFGEELENHFRRVLISSRYFHCTPHRNFKAHYRGKYLYTIFLPGTRTRRVSICWEIVYDAGRIATSCGQINLCIRDKPLHRFLFLLSLGKAEKISIKNRR